MYARIVLRALGVPPDGPTKLLNDNLGNLRVAEDAQASTRSRYFLVRSTVLHHRIATGEIATYHAKDPNNPADFLTKQTSGAKLEAAVKYANGLFGN